MSTYYHRQKADKIPVFKHRSLNWHLFMALGHERKMQTYKRLTGIDTCRIKVTNAAELAYAPIQENALAGLSSSKTRLTIHLLELYRQKVRLYFRTNLGAGVLLESCPIHTLYSRTAPSKAKPKKLLRRFIRGKTLIQHLQLALTRRGYLRTRAKWQAHKLPTTWAKFCSTYERSYHLFGEVHLPAKDWLAWDNYCKQNLRIDYHQHRDSKPPATQPTQPKR